MSKSLVDQINTRHTLSTLQKSFRTKALSQIHPSQHRLQPMTMPCTNLNKIFALFSQLLLTVIWTKADFLDTACFFQPLKLGRCDRALVSQVQFQLYTRNNPDRGYPLRTNDVANLQNSPFIKSYSVQLKILIHGLNSESVKAFLRKGKNAYVRLDEDVNVLVVDWTDAAIGSVPRRTYSEAGSCTLSVAEVTGALVKFLINQDYISTENIHLIGYDLGAHLAGMIGRQFGGSLSRITGLDPSRPCFRRQDPSAAARIRKEDAKFVDIIHTDGSTGAASNFGQGLLEQMGHVDFYANDGIRNQPGCGGKSPHVPNPGDNCNHERAYLLFIETISNPNAFIATACNSLTDFKRGNCDLREVRVVGHATPLITANDAAFYFRTRGESPYSPLKEKSST